MRSSRANDLVDSRIPNAESRIPTGSGSAAVAAAAIVATVAFWAYTKTLLPGVDLGDTGGFQAAVLCLLAGGLE